MRVTLISSVDAGGGAARAALRLHRGFEATGVASTMLVRQKTAAQPGVVEAPAMTPPGAAFWRLLQGELIDANRAGQWNTHFSLGLPGTDLSGHPVVRAADVIHLHWVADYLGVADVARLVALGKPVVWTLHDQRAFTGGCHYAFDCRGFETGCRDCPQLRMRDAQLPATMLANTVELLPPEAVTVVTPSRWLAGEARRSRAFRGARIEVIPYGLETNVFRPHAKPDCRAALGLPPDAFCLLFGADHGAERRKGFNELLEALRQCLDVPAFRRRCDSQQAALLCFGHPHDALAALPMPVKAVGYVRDDDALARVYSAADVFVLPSLADNLPCTMLESLACGTPVVAFQVGGIPDAVTDGVNGRLVPPGDVARLRKIILELADDAVMRANLARAARRSAESRFALDAQATGYRRLFEELLGPPRPVAQSTDARPCGPGLVARLPDFCRHALDLRLKRDQETKEWRALIRWIARLRRPRGNLDECLERLDRLAASAALPLKPRRRALIKNLLGFR